MTGHALLVLHPATLVAIVQRSVRSILVEPAASKAGKKMKKMEKMIAVSVSHRFNDIWQPHSWSIQGATLLCLRSKDATGSQGACNAHQFVVWLHPRNRSRPHCAPGAPAKRRYRSMAEFQSFNFQSKMPQKLGSQVAKPSNLWFLLNRSGQLENLERAQNSGQEPYHHEGIPLLMQTPSRASQGCEPGHTCNLAIWSLRSWKIGGVFNGVLSTSTTVAAVKPGTHEAL